MWMKVDCLLFFREREIAMFIPHNKIACRLAAIEEGEEGPVERV